MDHPQPTTDRRTLKIVLGLLVLALALAVLFLVPLMSKSPSVGPDVRLPAMQNVPQGTSLQIQVEPQSP